MMLFHISTITNTVTTQKVSLGIADSMRNIPEKDANMQAGHLSPKHSSKNVMLAIPIRARKPSAETIPSRPRSS